MTDIKLRITDKISWLLSKPKRVKIAVGGRGSAKSIGVGDIMLMFCDHGERICCSREFQSSIDDSVHESLKQEIDRLDAEGYTVLNNEIRSSAGGEIFYRGLARNISSLKSLAGVKRLWIEEGESVSDKSLRVLTPSIRSSAASNESDEEPPEIWITMNRGSSADAISKKYLKRAEKELARTGYYEDDMVMIVEVNFQDNPWFPPELEQERLDDEANLSIQEYEHVWGGKYNDTVEGAIIKPEWFNAAVDAHKIENLKQAFEPRGMIKVAHDPSDTGNDSKGAAVLHGSIFKYILEKTDGEIDDGCDWAMDMARQVGADWFIWDGDGMGAGLKRQVSSFFNGTRTSTHMFRGSLAGKGQDNAEEQYQPFGYNDASPNTFAQTFKNNRSQYYKTLADRFHNTYKCVVKGIYIDPDEMISIDSEGVEDMDILRAEICRIPKKKNPVGLYQIMSKQDMKTLDIESPNMADTMMMAICTVPDAFLDEEDDEEYEHNQNRNATTGY